MPPIRAPRLTRALTLINDTTEIDFGVRRKVRGLGPTGNGLGKGFFLHSALAVDAADGQVDGLVGQILFHRKPKSKQPKAKNTRRRTEDRESVVWGNLVDQVGSPPPGVKWVHVADRGADDFEVFSRIKAQQCSFVIRAAKLNRKVLMIDGRSLTVHALLEEQTPQRITELVVPATAKSEKRTATLELRYTELRIPMPTVLTPWLRTHRPAEPMQLWVVELREINAPKDVTPIRWVLYTLEPISNVD